jgi:hypothetical protein
MWQKPMTVAAMAQRLRRGDFAGGAGLELVAGVVLAAPRPSSAALQRVTTLAATFEAGYPEMRVAVREPFILSEVDLLRPEVALVRPLMSPAPPAPAAAIQPAGALMLAVFVGESLAPLRWRAQRCGRAGVVEAWTLALRDGIAERWREPHSNGYGRRERIEFSARLALDAVPERWLLYQGGLV